MPLRTFAFKASINLLAIIFCVLNLTAFATHAQTAKQDVAAVRQFVENHCLDCHDSSSKEGELDLESLGFDSSQFASKDFDTQVWEAMIRRLSAGQMPPAEAIKPTDAEYVSAISAIDRLLRSHGTKFPNPGRTDSIRRLNRTEYKNSIRDLLAINVDVETLLPKDESSHGFDNITVGELSPLLMNRYLAVAEKISRAAIGTTLESPEGVTIRLPADRSQEEHVDGLPLGTRGGTSFVHHFPKSGEYEIDIKLARDRDEVVEGLHHEHKLDILVDRNRVHRFTVKPPEDRKDFTLSDAHLNIRFKATAGSHNVGVTFQRNSSSLMETKRQPFDARFNRHRHPRRTPAIFQITIVGPFEQKEDQKDGKHSINTEARKLIFKSYPESPDEEDETAESILKSLMHRAYRRPISAEDLATPMRFYKQAADENGFEAGIELALTSILINPNFLFRIEEEPNDRKQGEIYKLPDIELATRLSYFLWSSLPDEELLQLAENNKLSNPDVLTQQVRRMLKDPKSNSLVENFASQWLYLRNLDSITPDLRLYPDFDDNLRHAFRGETTNLFRDVVENDKNILHLIETPYTFLNQRLAKHYGIKGVVGSHFRKVDLPRDSNRGGLLRHGSILTVTSYATRTSPTIRGAWVLENIFGTPPPPPPENVTQLPEKSTLKATTVRERLDLHRADPSCASCHSLIDPVGFALENYDALGRWRKYDDIAPIDSRGTLHDGTEIDGVEGIEAAIMKRPEAFVGTLTEKLLTFSIGRGVEHFDGPEVRSIVSAAKQKDFRFSAIIEGIVLSKPFRFRKVQ